MNMDGSGCLLSQRAEDAAHCHVCQLVRQQVGRTEQAEKAGKVDVLYAKASSTLF